MPIPLNLPSGSALAGLRGLGAPIAPLCIHFPSFSTVSFSSRMNAGFGTLNSPPSSHAALGRLIVRLSSHPASTPFSRPSPVNEAREEDRESALDGERELERDPNMRRPKPVPSFERRMGISLISGRRVRR